MCFFSLSVNEDNEIIAFEGAQKLFRFEKISYLTIRLGKRDILISWFNKGNSNIAVDRHSDVG